MSKTTQRLWLTSSSSAWGLRVLLFSSLSNFAYTDATAQQTVDRSKVFQLKDLDNNKLLDKEEFSGGSIGKMREKSDAEFERKDIDGNGELTLDEFLAAATWTEEEREEMRRDDFAREDKDGDGEINKEQFIGGKNGVELQFAEDMFAALDRNKDDVLDEDEFVNREELRNFPRVQFHYRDANRDGELTMDEFIRNDKGKAWEAARRQAFVVFDVNQDKVLSIDEFDKLETEAIRGREIGKLPKDQRLLAKYDLDADGSVTSAEFAQAVANERKPEKFAELLFAALDQNGDSLLDKVEINRMDTKDPTIEFAMRDIDGDRLLTLAEQIGDSRGKPLEKWRRQYFSQRDFDQDGALSPEEYAMAANDRRVMFIKLDVDKNGTLTLDEQLVGNVGKPAEEWLRYDFRGRDLDRDGLLTRDEFIIDGKDPRIEFSRRDANGDGLVTLEEHIARNLGKDGEKADRIFFRGHDFDHDGNLTPVEFNASNEDVRVKFGKKDEDADGFLSADEFLANAIGKDWEPHARRTFQLHDQNQDGMLSLEEFASTDEEAAEERRIRALAPEERGFARLDKSHDSRLSFEEFVARHEQDTFVVAQEKRIFRTLDFDGNGSLDLNEFLSKDEPIPQIQFANRDSDGDGKLSFEEYVRFMPPHVHDNQRLVFIDHDVDKNDSLSVDEFVQLENGRSSRERWTWFVALVGSPMTWVTAIVVGFDLVLVYLVGRAVIRRKKNKALKEAVPGAGLET